MCCVRSPRTCAHRDRASGGALGGVDVGSVQPSGGSLKARVVCALGRANGRLAKIEPPFLPSGVNIENEHIHTGVHIDIHTYSDDRPTLSLRLTLDGTINAMQVLLELLGEPVNAYGLNPG